MRRGTAGSRVFKRQRREGEGSAPGENTSAYPPPNSVSPSDRERTRAAGEFRPAGLNQCQLNMRTSRRNRAGRTGGREWGEEGGREGGGGGRCRQDSARRGEGPAGALVPATATAVATADDITTTCPSDATTVFFSVFYSVLSRPDFPTSDETAQSRGFNDDNDDYDIITIRMPFGYKTTILL